MSVLAALSTPADRTATLIAGLFPVPVGVALSDPAAPVLGLLPEETGAIADAVPARQREFAAGRRAARDAIGALGGAAPPIPMGDDRAPVWPAGIVGSISHAGGICAAVAAGEDAAQSLGLDIEPAAPLDQDLIAEICTPSERAWLATGSRADRPWLSRLIFSAKESAYKCQYPVSRTLFDFHTLEVTPDLDLGVFEATFVESVPDFQKGTQLSGRFMVSDGLIVTGVTLTA